MHEKSLELGVVLVILPVLLGERQERVGDELEQIASLVDEGAIAPAIAARFAFDDVSDAHETAEEGDHRGKVLLVNDE